MYKGTIWLLFSICRAALNNVNTEAIRSVVGGMDVDYTITEFTSSLLSRRVIISTLGTSSVPKEVVQRGKH